MQRKVIERPTVVKELIVRNDETLKLYIFLRDGGIRYINVYDDGDRIPKEDLLLSVERHATSKIRDYNDICSLSTLGFRGEALASIATVSHLTIKSLHKDSKGLSRSALFYLKINGGITE